MTSHIFQNEGQSFDWKMSLDDLKLLLLSFAILKLPLQTSHRKKIINSHHVEINAFLTVLITFCYHSIPVSQFKLSQV